VNSADRIAVHALGRCERVCGHLEDETHTQALTISAGNDDTICSGNELGT
jgi:hypothetical protein